MLKKRFTSLFLVLSMVLGLSAPAFAVDSTTDEWLVKYNETGSVYLESSITGERIVKAVRFDDNGIPYDVDLVAYVQELNSAQIINKQNDVFAPTPIISPYANVTSERYVESRAYYTVGTKEPVTAMVSGDPNGAELTYGESITISDGYAVMGGGSLTFTPSVKTNIQAGASFTWTTSAASSSSFSVTYPINPGEKGYVAFQPRLHATTGIYIRESINTETGVATTINSATITAYSPVLLKTGFAAGTYSLVLV